MSVPKVTPAQFIDFLIATPAHATAMEAQRRQPDTSAPAAHDAYTRLLHRLEPDSEALWTEVQPDVRRTSGVLVLHDSVLDKPYARKMDLVHHTWSGKHHRVVKGIDLLTLLWTDGDRHLPCDDRPSPRDDRIDDKPNDGQTKNGHFGDLLRVAQDRGFSPECVLFDGWYSSLKNLKRLQTLGWPWLTRLKSNRRVNPDRTGLRAVSACDIAASGTVVHLEGYGLVKVFRIVAKDGTTAHWATSNLELDELDRLRLADASWRIEEYHRGLETGDERGTLPVPQGGCPARPHRTGVAGVSRCVPSREDVAPILRSTVGVSGTRRSDWQPASSADRRSRLPPW